MIGAGDTTMHITRRRALRIAKLRSHLAGRSGNIETCMECVGRPYLIGAGTWLVASYLRSMSRRQRFFLTPR
jgi:hypothetical protein